MGDLNSQPKLYKGRKRRNIDDMEKGIALRNSREIRQLRKSERLVADYLRIHASVRNWEMGSITEFANTLKH